MKKRKLIGIICLSMAFFSTGCGNHTTDSTADNTVTEDNENNLNNDTNEEYTNSIDNNHSELDTLFDRDDILTGYTIITPYTQIILATDGTVLAKGINNYGQLGNGQRTDSETWSQVDNLNDIVQICNLGSLGDEPNDENGFGHCYALTSSGKLYRWGGNILTPELVFPDLTITEFKSLTSNKLFIRCESGENYLICARPGLYADDSVFSYASLSNTDELYGSYGGGFFLKSGDVLSYVDVASIGYSDSFYAIAPIEDKINNIIPINTSEKIKNIFPCVYNGFGSAVLLTDSGSIIGIECKGGETTIDNQGGSNIKKAFFGNTNFQLFQNGQLITSGDNEYGQLGDGTTIAYDDGFLEINDSLFSDFEYYDWPNKYCIAIDSQYNIWGWGKGLSSTPQIIVENSEFVHNN